MRFVNYLLEATALAFKFWLGTLLLYLIFLGGCFFGGMFAGVTMLMFI